MFKKKNFLIFLSFIILSCGSDDVEIDYSLRSDKVLYNEAFKALQNKDYDLAVETFTELDLQHPYSIWASKGQLMSGFALYQNNKYDEAVLILSKFINLNPNSKYLDYAYYLRGYCYYERIGKIEKDQKIAQQAYKYFLELKNKFPSSKYSIKANNHILLLTNQLAGKEMSIAKYYQKKQNFLASIARYKLIINDYKKSAQIPEVLYRLVECYLSLGVDSEAIKMTAILAYNFPNSIWYIDAIKLLKKFNLEQSSINEVKQKKILDLKKINLNDFNLN